MTDMAATRPDRTAQGIASILASVTAMAFGDAVVKLVSVDLTIWQVFVDRSAFAIPCLIALAYATDGRLKPRAPKWVVVRSALLILAWLAFYASLPVLNLAVAAVAAYTNPILTALLTAFLLGERVTARQWMGVSFGFLGVAAILRPGSDAFSWAVALPVLSAACYSVAMVLTRRKCQEEDAIGLALSLHVAFIVTGLIASSGLLLADLGAPAKAAYPFLLGDGAAMGVRAWGLMAFLGVLSAAFFIGVARAYQIAPPPIIATFDYGYLVSAALWGFVFFSEKPDVFTILGMALITAAGILVAAPWAKKLDRGAADALVRERP